MRFINFIILIVSLNTYAQITKLPKFLTKQSLEYLRFIDKSGKFTYYQTSNGSLNLTSNYDNNVLYESQKGSHFLVTSKVGSNIVLVELIEKLHSNLNLNKNYKIFYSKIGETKISEIATGRNPSMSLNDSWLTYFDATKKLVKVKSIKGNKFSEIKLINQLNQFFIPQIDMLNPETVIYTDINLSGHMALLAYNTTDKSFKPIYKSKFPSSKIEFCRIGDDLFIGEFSIYDSDKGSSLVKVPIFNNANYANQTTIYRSEQADLGNILCDKQSIYFIKTLEFNANLNSKVTEVANLDLKSNQLTIASDLKNVTQIIEFGGRILIPYRDNFYIVKGDHDTTKQDVLDN